MQILEDQRRRLLEREGFDVPARREEQRLLVGGMRRREAEEDGQVGRHLVDVHVAGDWERPDVTLERVPRLGFGV